AERAEILVLRLIDANDQSKRRGRRLFTRPRDAGPKKNRDEGGLLHLSTRRRVRVSTAPEIPSGASEPRCATRSSISVTLSGRDVKIATTSSCLPSSACVMAAGSSCDCSSSDAIFTATGFFAGSTHSG